MLSARTKRFANRMRQALKMAAMSLLHSERLGTGPSTADFAVEWTSRAPTPPRPTSSRACRTSCSPVARPSSIKASNATSSSSARNPSPHSSAAPPRSASRSLRHRRSHQCLRLQFCFLREQTGGSCLLLKYAPLRSRRSNRKRAPHHSRGCAAAKGQRMPGAVYLESKSDAR